MFMVLASIQVQSNYILAATVLDFKSWPSLAVAPGDIVCTITSLFHFTLNDKVEGTMRTGLWIEVKTGNSNNG
jgi:hypothetical protein